MTYSDRVGCRLRRRHRVTPNMVTGWFDQTGPHIGFSQPAPRWGGQWDDNGGWMDGGEVVPTGAEPGWLHPRFRNRAGIEVCGLKKTTDGRVKRG
jgi:hypothetical protein